MADGAVCREEQVLAAKRDYCIEASKQARITWGIYLGFLAYSVLTIAGSSDRQIVLNKVVHLPIINSEVPLSGFFIVAPLLSILLFVYFHLQLRVARKSMHDLDDNCTELPKKFYPWIVHLAENPEPGWIGWFQKACASIGLWWSLPVVLLLFASKIIKKHDLLWSYPCLLYTSPSPRD